MARRRVWIEGTPKSHSGEPGTGRSADCRNSVCPKGDRAGEGGYYEQLRGADGGVQTGPKPFQEGCDEENSSQVCRE